MPVRGTAALLQILADTGVRYLFGNPGTTELPLMDALIDTPIRFILGLQEVPVVAMADGYAQASRQLGVVNLHVSCGLGNAMGMVYNAFRAQTPLLLTAGQQDQRLAFEEPILWGEMVEVARPWTKWAAEVRRVEDLPPAVARAVQVALTPPQGPVFLSLPLDVQAAEAELDLAARQPLDCRFRPPQEAITRAATLLATARNPAILVGSRIQEAGAVEELVAVAEKLGAPVIHEAGTSHGRCSFPSNHPLAAWPLPFWSPQVHQRLAEFDVLLVAGMKLLQQYIYHEPRAIPGHMRLVQLDDDPREIGKNYPVEVGLLGHPQPTLAELAAQLDVVMSAAHIRAAQTRARNRAEQHFQQREALRREAESLRNVRPMKPLALMAAVARVLPDDVAVIEESPTTTQGYLERSGALRNTSGYFAQRGWSLGWGLNCAMGVQLAWPDRPVLGIIGDGAAMYGIQGLWTAARERLPVTILVTNNRQYRILKDCAQVLQLPHAARQEFLGLDLAEPAIDYVGLARALGVAARRVADPDELSEALRASWAAAGPELIEATIVP